MTHLSTTIDIDAPALRVWAVLTDFPAYRLWNPFITHIEGTPTQGAQLTVRIAPEGRPPVTVRPRVVHADPAERLVWKGHAIVPGFFDGAFRLEPLDRDRCRLIHAETFAGVLVPLVAPMLLDATRAGFEAMNAALKSRAENGRA